MTGEIVAFKAEGLEVEELLKFLKDFSELESTSFTRTIITFNETSPRLCTVVIEVEAKQSWLITASFKDGLLNHDSWSKKFIQQG